MKSNFGNVLSSAFDMIAWINLDSRPDRWEYVQRQFESVGLLDKILRVPAIDLRTNPELQKQERLVSGNFSLLARYGCMFSHRKAIALALEAGCSNVLVFEDDIKFVVHDVTAIQYTIEALSHHSWQVFYLGATYLFDLEFVSDYLVRVPNGAYATHAIAYSSATCETLIKILPSTMEEVLKSKTIEDFDAIDLLLTNGPFQRSQFYGANPMMVVQGLQESDIAKVLKFDIALKQAELFKNQIRKAKLRSYKD